MKIGVNTFGPKFALYDDFDGTLARMKAGEIGSLEVCVDFKPKEEGDGVPQHIPAEVLARMSGGIWQLEDAAGRIAKVREAGFEVISTHVMVFGGSPSVIDSLAERLIAYGRENSIRYFVLSLMVGVEKMKEYVPAMRHVSQALAAEGMCLCYHNHEIECYVEDGDTALDMILRECPDLMLELDMGWAKFAGQDPVALMNRYADRLKLIHLKDVSADACPENRATCFTIVGEGSIPLTDIITEAMRMGYKENEIIIDQDDSPRDIIDDIKMGAVHVNEAAAR